jgi:hypothetical protein
MLREEANSHTSQMKITFTLAGTAVPEPLAKTDLLIALVAFYTTGTRIASWELEHFLHGRIAGGAWFGIDDRLSGGRGCGYCSLKCLIFGHC